MPQLSHLGPLRSGIHLRGTAGTQPDGEHLIVQLGDVREGEINFDRVIRMDLDRARPKDYLAPGDILLRSRGASYGAALVLECPVGTLAAAPLYVLRLETPGVEADYVVWFINRPMTQAQLGTSAHGTHIPTVSLEAFGKLDIVLPAQSEQRRILEMEQLFQQEKDITSKYMERRGQLVQLAQETILEKQF